MTTDTERWRRLEEIYRLAAKLPAETRRVRLDELCGADVAMRREIESMIEASRKAGAFLEAPLTSMLDVRNDVVGREIGRWRILEHLGSGGMGEVYRAERADGAFEQQAALKLISGHVLSPDLRRRFHRERQILARLEHPNIARLVDGGVTDDGRQYLAMEYVQGRSLIDYCAANDLDLDERLRLFGEVCDVVAHAHGQLVIHRDLKPDNIFVTDDGTVKLLDFGIAAVLDDDGARTDVTLTQHQRYTPQYASPEQVQGAPITTASDVYSLGLILYELLVGRRPYEVAGASADANARMICATMPPPPSRALGEVHMRRRLRGDLDTIVMTALRKEPERRYRSVEALAEDLRRYRQSRPIAARPDCWSYRATKFVRRNRLPVAASLILLAVLGAATIVTAIQANVANRQREQAVIALDTSDAVQRFLLSILTAAQPHEAGQEATVRDALDRAADRVEQELGGRPAVEARVREAIGSTYRTLGALEAADEQLAQASALAPEAFGVDHPETASITHELGMLRRDQGRFQEAAALLRQAVTVRARTLGAEHADTTESRSVLAQILGQLERFDEAITQLEAVVEVRERTQGLGHPDTLLAKNDLAEALLRVGRVDESLALNKSVYEAQVAALGADHIDTLISSNDVGQALLRADRVAEALPWFERAVAGLSSQVPPGSIDIVVPRINLARALAGVDRLDEAIAIELETLPEAEAALGSGNYVVGLLCLFAGEHLLAAGRADEAATLADRAVDVLAAAFGGDSGWASQATRLRESVTRALEGALPSEKPAEETKSG
jgi:tetratricopeptide (TPR) repeat protein